MSAYHLIIGITLILAGLLIGWVALEGKKETLKPNFWIGIRTTELLKSEQAWTIGHKAAAFPLLIGAGGVILAGLISLFVPFDAVTITSMVGTGWMLVFLLIGGAKATKSAKAA